MKTFVGNALRILALISSAGAFALGIYLLLFALSKEDTLRTCGGGDCDEVLNSSWATWFGIPVVAFGIATYVMFFVAYLVHWLARPKAIQKFIDWALPFAAVSIVLGAVYFFVIQAAVLGVFCRSCMITHGMAVMAVLVGWLGLRMTGAARLGCNIWSSQPARFPGPGAADPAKILLVRRMASDQDQESQRLGPFPALASAGLATVCFAMFVVLHVLDPGPETHRLLDPGAGNRNMAAANAGPGGVSNPGPGANPAIHGPSIFSEPSVAGNPGSANNRSESTADLSTTDSALHAGSDSNDDAAPRVRLANNIEFKLGQFPIVGSAAAPHVIVKLFDYHCNNCRAFHRDFKKVLPEYEDDFALVLIPCPLERECIPDLPQEVRDHVHSCELAKIALAVWRLAPDQFEAYQDWAMVEDRDPKDARTRAEELVGGGRLADAIDDPALGDDILIAGKAFHSYGGPKMPKVFLPSGRIIVGVVRTWGDLRKILNEEIRLIGEAEQ